MSFQLVQIDQHIADMPILILALSNFFTPLSQFPNILVILAGGGKLKVKSTIRQTILANGHAKNK
jgi:di/tricarboxylate transporter